MESIPSSPPLNALFRRAASFIPSGVAVLSTADVLMTVSSLHCVSHDPPWIGVSLAANSAKGDAVRSSRRFKAVLLGEKDEELTRAERLPGDAGLVEFECRIQQTHRAGDHYLVLAEVEDISIRQGNPLLYWRRGLHPFRPHYGFAETRDSFERFLETWEAGKLSKREWTHGAHVAMAAAYSVRYRAGAFDRIKAGIIRHNESCGTANTDTSGYHETLTRLWARVVGRAVANFDDPWLAARHALEQFGEDRDLHCLYYSFDVVRSVEARRCWVRPDLGSID